MRRISLLLALLLALPIVPAAADCTDSTGVFLNEVRYLDANSPVGDRMNALVELYNKGSLPVALDGWTVTDQNAGVRYTFPAINLPGGAFVVLEFGTGVTDLDFSDGLGRIATNGDSVQIFDPVTDGVGLYAGAPSLGNVRDFVAWSADGSAATGTAASHASSAGLWPALSTIAVTDSTNQFALRLWPDGVDDDDVASWNVHTWDESFYQSWLEGPNAAQIDPVHGSGIEPGAVTFTWSATARAGVTYRLIVATDPSLTSGIVVDALTTSTDTTVTLGDALHHWTVRAVDSCGESPSPVWRTDVFAYPTSPQLAPGEVVVSPDAFGSIGIVRLKQRKDSRLLCLYDARLNTRPGCTRAAGNAGPWDAAHPQNHALTCPHCGWYCVRASSRMIAKFYGGNVSQDRIAMGLEQVQSRTANPEKNIQHNMGVLPIEIEATLEFALAGENVTAFNASYALLKSEIQAGYPVLVTKPRHAMVCAGFIDAGQLGPNRPDSNMIRLVDPWPSRPEVRYMTFPTSQVNTAWTVRPLPSQTITGRNDEPEMTTDTDGDGVVDFDEGAPNYPLERPRRLQSRHNDVDTDNDDIYDKNDIAGYTFHTCADNDTIIFPDIDQDGLRGEADCDSDNGGLFDGGEDILGIGICNLLTDPYNPAGDGIGVATDKGLYFVPDEVKLTGAPFQADTTYRFSNIIGCPNLVHGQAIGAAGALSTNGFGVIPFQKVADCSAPGLWLTVVDVLHNSIYESPRCQNPVTCWVCLEPVYTTDLDAMPEWDSMDKVEYTFGSVTWQHTPDGMHNGSGFYAELNGPGNPTNPIDTGLRTPQFIVEPGDQVFLTYWTAFFSQNMQGVIRVSNDNGNSWTPVFQYGPPDDQFNGVEILDITPALFGPAPQDGYAAAADSSMPCIVEFHAFGPPGSGGWFVDDIGIGRIPGGTVGVPGPPAAEPGRFMLAQNNPNPFRGSTTIGFDVPRDAGNVTLRVFDVAGRRIRTLQNGPLEPGRHVRVWNGRNETGSRVPAGIYFYRLEGNGWEDVRRMTKVVR